MKLWSAFEERWRKWCQVLKLPSLKSNMSNNEWTRKTAVSSRDGVRPLGMITTNPLGTEVQKAAPQGLWKVNTVTAGKFGERKQWSMDNQYASSEFHGYISSSYPGFDPKAGSAKTEAHRPGLSPRLKIRPLGAGERGAEQILVSAFLLAFQSCTEPSPNCRTAFLRCDQCHT